MKETGFPPRVMHQFVHLFSSEIGHDTFKAVLNNAGLPEEWAEAAHFSALDAERTAQAYARLQSAMRTYYGRGARGILMRVGTKLWAPLLENASFGLKSQSALIRGLPAALKRKPALELLAKMLGSANGDITVHSLDLDLLLVDHASPTTMQQTDDNAICFVTQGLIRECLYWADGREHDIEERTCKAMGAKQCEFKITIGA